MRLMGEKLVDFSNGHGDAAAANEEEDFVEAEQSVRAAVGSFEQEANGGRAARGGALGGGRAQALGEACVRPNYKAVVRCLGGGERALRDARAGDGDLFVIGRRGDWGAGVTL